MSRTRARTKIVTRPAPLGGWNTRDPLAEMSPRDAIILDNWIPQPGGLKMRPGYQAHITPSSGIVGTLMGYAPPGGTEALFAAIGANIYNVTSLGALGSPVYGSGALTTPFWSHTMQTSAATSVLFMVNGSDSPVHYNGSAWANPSITGVTASTFRTVTNHKNRLWFTVGTLLAYYLPNNSIAGAATAFDLGPVAKRGGQLVNIGTWTRDGGLGPDDYIVFLTDKGEAIVYAGTDPSSASTWGLVGVYQLPPPVGKRNMLRVGADLVIMTVRGLMPMSQAMTLAESGAGNAALTGKISPAWEAATRSNFGFDHWQMIEWPRERLLISNIPTASTTSVQYVMQVETLGWCRFLFTFSGASNGIISWATLAGDMYVGDSVGGVWKIGGSSDPGDADGFIAADVLFAYEKPTGRQRVTMARPAIFSTASPSVFIKSDYDTSISSLNPNLYVDADDDPLTMRMFWQACAGFGHAVAPGMRVRVDGRTFRLESIDLMVEEGGTL
jgi:hypothetical protein